MAAEATARPQGSPLEHLADPTPQPVGLSPAEVEAKFRAKPNVMLFARLGILLQMLLIGALVCPWTILTAVVAVLVAVPSAVVLIRLSGSQRRGDPKTLELRPGGLRIRTAWIARSITFTGGDVASVVIEESLARGRVGVDSASFELRLRDGQRVPLGRVFEPRATLRAIAKTLEETLRLPPETFPPDRQVSAAPRLAVRRSQDGVRLSWGRWPRRAHLEADADHLCLRLKRARTDLDVDDVKSLRVEDHREGYALVVDLPRGTKRELVQARERDFLEQIRSELVVALRLDPRR